MINDRIKALRKEYEDDRAGYRRKKWRCLGQAMAIVLELKSNEKSAKSFFKLADDTLPEESDRKLRKNLTAAVICYIKSAKTESAVKQVWKEARALDYLIEIEEVEPDDIAAEIEKRGGIEKIAKAAAQQDPRRPKVKLGKKEAKPALQKKLKKQSSLPTVEDEDDDWSLDSNGAGAGDLTTITVQVHPSQLSDILGLKKGQRMTWICSRVDADNDDLAVAEIQEVRPL
jgi:hypothetical protein